MKKIIALALVLCSLLLLCACARTEEPRGIRTIEINEKGELIVIFTDGTQSNAGVVKGEKGDTGEKGADGKDGVDGQDGKDGEDGKDGAAGAKGDKGTEGRNGTSIESVTANESGELVVTFSDGTTSEISLMGKLYLFGGECGEGAFWGFYNGGVLVIGGEGVTDSYNADNPAPWSVLIPMIQGVVIDRRTLTESEGLLFGIGNDIPVERIEDYEVSYIDMTEKAEVYDTETLENKIGELPVCTEIRIVERGDTYAKIILEDGGYGYIDIDYVRVGDAGSMIYEAPEGFEKVKVTNPDGANLRTFPDASGSDNIAVKSTEVPMGTELVCISKSQNEKWYRVSYDGKMLYVSKIVVEEIPLQQNTEAGS